MIDAAATRAQRDRMLAVWLDNFQKRILELKADGEMTDDPPGEVKRVTGLMKEISQRLSFYAKGGKPG